MALDVEHGLGAARIVMASEADTVPSAVAVIVLVPAATPVTVPVLLTEAIVGAREDARRAGLDNVECITADPSDFDETADRAAFDLVTALDAIHDQAKPRNVLRGIYSTLKPDGVYFMQDFSGSIHVEKDIRRPIGTFLYTVSCMHCMTVSLARGGEGLGALWGEDRTREYLKTAGFRSVETKRLPHDIQNNWSVARR